MGKVAFVFPGQAAQYPGMGKELTEKYAVARAVHDRDGNVVAAVRSCRHLQDAKRLLTARRRRRPDRERGTRVGPLRVVAPVAM
jgi:malonyl CoA-acyl carrier protein transacylase